MTRSPLIRQGEGEEHQLLKLAAKICTPKELAAYELAAKGMSERAIALHLNISRSAVQSRLENAKRKIRLARKENAA